MDWSSAQTMSSGSPLEWPFVHQTRQHQLPRFVYFGPNAGDTSVRLQRFLAGN